jgi:hypothetical protein
MNMREAQQAWFFYRRSIDKAGPSSNKRWRMFTAASILQNGWRADQLLSRHPIDTL